MNLNIWDIMAPAFFELLILVGIHSYLGLHVIRRKVIFVDLALAQIAALGTTVGFLFGIMPGSFGAYWFSLSFTFVGAAVFSVSRIRHEKIPQEAVIGLAYAIAAAVAILVIDKAPHGAEHIKEILTGSILWVKWSSIRNAAIVYSIVGVFHFIYRKQFLLISTNPEKAYSSGINVKFWDFLFYVSFGIVITHSVGTAGVLLVFVFLIVPAITSMLITDVLWKQLLIGWSMGVVVSAIGLYISYIADLPSGPTVVAFYGLMLVFVALIVFYKNSDNRMNSLLKIAFGIGVTLIVIFGFYVMGNAFSNEHHHESKIEQNINESNSNSKTDNIDLDLLSEHQIDSLLAQNSDILYLSGLFNKTNDEFNRTKIAKRVTELNLKKGADLLLSILKTSSLPFIKEEANKTLNEFAKTDFGFDVLKELNGNKLAINKIEAWIKSLK